MIGYKTTSHRPLATSALPLRPAITNARNLALVLALAGLILAALFVNVGFWASAARAESIAQILSLPAIAAWSFTVAAFVAAALLHWLKVTLPRR